MSCLSTVPYVVIEPQGNIMGLPLAMVAKVSSEDPLGKIISTLADSAGIALWTRISVINAGTADFESALRPA